MNTDLASNLSQGERLELSARPSIIIPPDSIGTDERRVLSVPPNGFRMPSMERVREHDARMSAYGSDSNVHDDESDEESDEESELREHALAKRMDSMREHSLLMPSQRSRADVRDSLAFMGMAWGE